MEASHAGEGAADAPPLQRQLSKSAKKRMKKKEREQRKRNASAGVASAATNDTADVDADGGSLVNTPAESPLENDSQAAPPAAALETAPQAASVDEAVEPAPVPAPQPLDAAPTQDAPAPAAAEADTDAAAPAAAAPAADAVSAPAPTPALPSPAPSAPAEAVDAAGAADADAKTARSPPAPAHTDPQLSEYAIAVVRAAAAAGAAPVGSEGEVEKEVAGAAADAAGPTPSPGNEPLSAQRSKESNVGTPRTVPAQEPSRTFEAKLKDVAPAAAKGVRGGGSNNENDIVDALVIPSAMSEMVPATGSYQLESSGLDEKELIMDLEIPKTTSLYTCERSKAESMCEKPKKVEVKDRKFGNILTFEGKAGGGLQYWVNDAQRPDIHKIDYEEGLFVLKFPELNKGCYLPSIVRSPADYYRAMSELRRLCSIARVRNSIPPDTQLPVLLPYFPPPPGQKGGGGGGKKAEKPCPIVLLKHQASLRLMFVREEGHSEASVAFLEYSYDPPVEDAAAAATTTEASPTKNGGKPPKPPKSSVFDTSKYEKIEYTVRFYSAKWDLRYECVVTDERREASSGKYGGFTEVVNLCQAAGVWAYPAVGVPLPTHLDLEQQHGDLEVPPAPLKIALANRMTALLYPQLRRGGGGGESAPSSPRSTGRSGSPGRGRKDPGLSMSGVLEETLTEKAITLAADMGTGAYQLMCYRTDTTGATTDTPVNAVVYNPARCSLSVSSSDHTQSGLTLNLKLPPATLLSEVQLEQMRGLFKATCVGFVTKDRPPEAPESAGSGAGSCGSMGLPGVVHTVTNENLSGFIGSPTAASGRALASPRGAGLSANNEHDRTIVIGKDADPEGESLSLLVVLWGFGATPESRHLKLKPRDKVSARDVHRHLSQDTQWLEAREGAVDRTKFDTQAVYWVAMADTQHPSFCPQTIQPAHPLVQQGYRSGASAALHIVHTSAKELLQYFRAKAGGGGRGKKGKDCCIQ